MFEGSPEIGSETRRPDGRPDLQLVTTQPQQFSSNTHGPEVNFSVWKAKSPQDVPIVVFGGFMGVEAAYGPLGQAIASMNTDAVTVDLPHRLPLRHEIDPRNFMRTHRLASVGMRTVIEELTERHGYDQLDVMVHSKAGRDIMWSAHHMPEKIRSLILFNSVGLGHNIFDMALGVPGFLAKLPSIVRDSGENLKTQVAARQLAEYLLPRPHRPIGEIAAIARADVISRLGHISEQGVKIVVIETEGDNLLSPLKTISKVKDLVDHHEVTCRSLSGHEAPIRQPVATALLLIDTLERLHGLPKPASAA